MKTLTSPKIDKNVWYEICQLDILLLLSTFPQFTQSLSQTAAMCYSEMLVEDT